MTENTTSTSATDLVPEPSQSTSPRAEAQESGGAWARRIANLYLGIAKNAVSPLSAAANSAEASKYFAIADRLDGALPGRDGTRAP